MCTHKNPLLTNGLANRGGQRKTKSNLSLESGAFVMTSANG